MNMQPSAINTVNQETMVDQKDQNPKAADTLDENNGSIQKAL